MRSDWNFRTEIIKKVAKQGGWVNTHTHLDRAYTITPEMLPLAEAQLQQKWDIVDEIKRNSSVDQIYDRMCFAVEQQIAQGVTMLGSFIDVDAVIGDKAMKAAERVREKYKNDIKLVYINQALKGVLEEEASMWFKEAVPFVDIIGGLPAKDAGREDEHLDVLFEAAKKYRKMVHVHVDQLNTSAEKETEQLVKKTIEHGWQGKVAAIHGISLAAHPQKYRQKVYELMRENEVMMISCPTAWIDARRSEEMAVTHNSIAPVEELVAAGVGVAIGADNIADVYKPFGDGDMWTELRFMLESCHFYNIEELVKIATSNGRKVLGEGINFDTKKVGELEIPFYDPAMSYEDNYKYGPFSGFIKPNKIERLCQPKYDFLGHKLQLPFGIPAGPLLNSKFVTAAFEKGFDACVYKTVRTREYPCHPAPNILASDVRKLSVNRKKPLVVGTEYKNPLTITNSFGVPSADPTIWQEDMALAVEAADVDQVMIGSFQGTLSPSGNTEEYIDDFVRAAMMVKETGAPILEANLSCPNEGGNDLLCFDTPMVKEIATRIKKAVGHTPLILKLAYFEDSGQLKNFVKELGGIVQGFSAVNTLPATVVNDKGEPALPGKGREKSGMCGSAITWAGLEMAERLAKLRKKFEMSFVIIGVGGVSSQIDYQEYRARGADVVMSATASMWNSNLAQEIYSQSEK